MRHIGRQRCSLMNQCNPYCSFFVGAGGCTVSRKSKLLRLDYAHLWLRKILVLFLSFLLFIAVLKSRSRSGSKHCDFLSVGKVPVRSEYIRMKFMPRWSICHQIYISSKKVSKVMSIFRSANQLVARSKIVSFTKHLANEWQWHAGGENLPSLLAPDQASGL